MLTGQLFNFFSQTNTNFDTMHDRLNFEKSYKAPLQRSLEKHITFAQLGFVFVYTGLMLKLCFFNHYRKYNKFFKCSFLLVYQITIDPLTLLAGYGVLAIRSKTILEN